MNQGSSKKLYVGSLPYSTTEDELRGLFESFGEIESVRIITDKFTGMSKGFGFVEMANADDAQKAVEGMNGKQLNGRTLIVNEARPEQRRDRSFSGGEGGNRGGGDRWGGGQGGAGDRPRRPRRDSY
ncbi:MAG: RNA-binding protein [Rhabdochlamydiaceae bacterium]|nr:RNA-binding protein [Rhabdochlamydiaceae bacterium]